MYFSEEIHGQLGSLEASCNSWACGFMPIACSGPGVLSGFSGRSSDSWGHPCAIDGGWFNQVLEGSIKSIQKIIWLQTARVQPAKDMFISGRGDGTAPGADWVDTLRLVDSVAFDRDFPWFSQECWIVPGFILATLFPFVMLDTLNAMLCRGWLPETWVKSRKC